MRVKEMHPLCCISLESPSIGNQSPDMYLPRTKSLPASLEASGSEANNTSGGSEGSTTVAGILYKWTNYGKGWRSRWFLLKNGVLSYAKIRRPENLNLLSPSDDVRLIGDVSTHRLSRLNSESNLRRKYINKTPSPVVHLKVITIITTTIILFDYSIV